MKKLQNKHTYLLYLTVFRTNIGINYKILYDFPLQIVHNHGLF